jgi:hypothetical protein
MSETVADLVRIVFEATGQAEVARAFEGVEAKMARFERSASQQSAQGVRERVRTALQERKEREATYAALFKQIDAKEKESAKATEKAARDKAKADADSARDRLRAEENLARAKERIVDNSARYAGRMATQQADAEIREAKRSHEEQMRLSRHRASAIGGRVGGAVSGGISRSLGTVGMLAGGALAIGGGFSFANAIGGELRSEGIAAQFVNAVTTGKAPPTGIDVNSVIAQAGVVSASTGTKKEELLEGALAYARSARGGDAKGALANMSFFAKMSKVTGTSVTDLAEAAGTLQSQNADLDPAGMQKLLLSSYAQSKAGAISVSEAAKQFGTLGSTRGFYQGDEAHNQQTLMALGQIAASGGMKGDVGTYIKDVSVEAAKHRHTKGGKAGLESMGVHFDQYGRMESAEQMIGQVFKGTKGDLGKIGEIFGARGLPLFTELQKSFTSAGGGDAGVAAVQKQIANVTTATMTPGDLEAQFSQSMSTTAEKFAVAVNKIEELIATKAMPVLNEWADKLSTSGPQIEAFIDKLASAVSWLAENPWSGLGLLIAGNITRSLVDAGIGAAVKTVITSILTEGAAGNVAANALNTGGTGKGAGIPGLLGAAAVTASILYSVGNAAEEGEKSGHSAAATAVSVMESAAVDVKSGKMTKTQAERAVLDAKGLLATAKDKSDTAHQALDLASVPLAPFSSDARKAIAETHAADTVVKNEGAIVKAMEALTLAIKSAPIVPPGAVSMADPNNPARKQTIAVAQ